MNNLSGLLLVLSRVTASMTTEAFCEAFRSLFEYRRLIGRREAERHGLSDIENARLEQLGRLWQWRPEDGGSAAVPPPQSRRFARCDVQVAAELRVRGADEPVTIVNLGGGGAVVVGMPPLRPGELVLLKVRLAGIGCEYQFPAQVRWRSEGFAATAARVALAFVGIPEQQQVEAQHEAA
jgi:PilZ domain